MFVYHEKVVSVSSGRDLASWIETGHRTYGRRLRDGLDIDGSLMLGRRMGGCKPFS